jgi:hypothetical protein
MERFTSYGWYRVMMLAATASAWCVERASFRKPPTIRCEVQDVPDEPGLKMLVFSVRNIEKVGLLLESIEITNPQIVSGISPSQSRAKAAGAPLCVHFHAELIEGVNDPQGQQHADGSSREFLLYAHLPASALQASEPTSETSVVTLIWGDRILPFQIKVSIEVLGKLTPRPPA